MQPRPNLTTLPALTNPTLNETKFIVQDSTVIQTITSPQAKTLLTDDLISLTEIKAVVAASSNFEDFQSRIAAL